MFHTHTLAQLCVCGVVQIKIILRTRQANPIPVQPNRPHSPAYGAPVQPYSGSMPLGAPYVEQSSYPHYLPPDLNQGQVPAQPPPPNYPNPNYGQGQNTLHGGASPGHGTQQPLQQGPYQPQSGPYQQGYEGIVDPQQGYDGVVDPQQYPGGYEGGQPQYSGEIDAPV